MGGPSLLTIERKQTPSPSLLKLLPSINLNSPHLAIFEASFQKQEAGILVGSILEEARIGEIEALAVLPAFQRQGIGTALIQAFEKELKRLDSLIALKSYEEASPKAQALEGVFRQLGWTPPQPFLKRYFFEVQAFHPSWFEKESSSLTEAEFFPWNLLKEEDVDEIERLTRGGAAPFSVYPFGEEKTLIEPLNSFGLRYRQKLIGWMVTHRIAPDTIRYAYLYVRDDFRRSGISIQLLKKAIQKQQESSIPYSTFEVREQEISRRWRRFIALRLAPYAKTTTRTLLISKKIC